MTDVKPTVAVEAKPMRHSWTLWFNQVFANLPAIILVLVAVREGLLEMQVTLPAWVLGGIGLFIGVGNTILRIRTTQPVTSSATPSIGEAPAPPLELRR